MKKKVLITGGAGFIGHHTANELAREGYQVRILDNLCNQVHPDPKESLARLDPSVECICGDVRNDSHLRKALEGVDVVYHFAAETGVGQSMYEIERYCDINIRGTALLCDCLARKKGGIEKLILSSSRAVYGEGQYKCQTCGIVYPGARSLVQLKIGEWDPVCVHCGAEVTPIACQEATPCRPVSIYGLTKKNAGRFIEHNLQHLQNTSGNLALFQCFRRWTKYFKPLYRDINPIFLSAT